MRIILSRKGFDSANGGCPSPILPDGELLSLPIPADDPLSYAEIGFRGLSCAALLKQLNPKKSYDTCHLDPDIRPDMRLSRPAGWRAAFGQTDAAQSHLKKHGIGKGDLFLFFGWFRRVCKKSDDRFSYVRDAPDLHVLFGYLQVETVLSRFADIAEFWWHPHADPARSNNKRNALYLAADALTFDPSMPGCGTFRFSENRVLTKPDQPKRATWKEIPALMPENIVSRRKNSALNGGLYYSGIWQEMILQENALSEEWAKSMIGTLGNHQNAAEGGIT